MNKNRRQQLREWIERVNVIKYQLELILSDEEMYFDMMPENLQGGINGMNSEESMDKMNEAIKSIEEAIGSIEEII